MVAPTLALVAYLKKICLPFWNMKTYRQILLTGLVIAASTEKFHFVYSPSRNFSWNYIQKLLKKKNQHKAGWCCRKKLSKTEIHVIESFLI